MEVSISKIRLHPLARELLFQHYRTLQKIFRDVLGLFEIDYISIGLINPKGELLFLSSKPSIESNLIENNLWPFDAGYCPDFFLQSNATLWEDRETLFYYKQQIPKLSIGLSIPSSFDEYRVVYNFASKSTDKTVKANLTNNIESLRSMGRFCLHNITQTIALPNWQNNHAMKKPTLTLISNNKESI